MKILLTFLLIIPFSVCGRTTTVDRPFITSSELQKIFDDSEQGDTVRIGKVSWKVRDIIITKRIYVQGIGMPVFDGEGTGHILLIKCNGVTIDGLHIRNSGFSGYNDPAGIKIENAKDVSIINCRIENCFFGIYYSNCTDGLVKNNRISSNKKTETSSGNGVHLWKCSKINIRNNQIRGHRDGIYLEFATESEISSNFSENNIRYGLHFMFSHNDSYIENTFKNNGAGVAVMYTKNVNMFRNIFIDNRGTTSYGLLLKDITDSKISGNIFKNNTCAITMEECNRININRNEFTSNGWAMRVQASCSDNVITINNFTGNTFDITTNGTMVMNTFKGNYWDKYNGYDLNRDKKGDVPYLPVSMYSIIVDQIPVAMILYRSFIVTVLEQMEKIIPSITPAQLSDTEPLMKPAAL